MQKFDLERSKGAEISNFPNSVSDAYRDDFSRTACPRDLKFGMGVDDKHVSSKVFVQNQGSHQATPRGLQILQTFAEATHA